MHCFNLYYFPRTLQQIPFKMLCASFDQLVIGAKYLKKKKKSYLAYG